MISYYYKVEISPDSGKKEASDKTGISVKTWIYLSFSSSNKIYENKLLRDACKLYVLDKVPNPQAIMPLDYKKLGKMSSSPLVKINVFLESSVTDSTGTDTAVTDSTGTDTAATDVTLGQGIFPLLPVTPSASSSSSIKKKKLQIFACRSGTNVYTICKNILGLKNLKIDVKGWKITRVTAIDRLLVDVRNG